VLNPGIQGRLMGPGFFFGLQRSRDISSVFYKEKLE
jgi:hypothetical protein